VPALFLAEPGAGRITPISYGVLSIDELTERLIAIANPPAPAIGAATPTQPMPLEATP
jgi:conjugal transfer pilus assembly protein TraF